MARSGEVQKNAFVMNRFAHESIRKANELMFGVDQVPVIQFRGR